MKFEGRTNHASSSDHQCFIPIVPYRLFSAYVMYVAAFNHHLPAIYLQSATATYKIHVLLS